MGESPAAMEEEEEDRRERDDVNLSSMVLVPFMLFVRVALLGRRLANNGVSSGGVVVPSDESGCLELELALDLALERDSPGVAGNDKACVCIGDWHWQCHTIKKARARRGSRNVIIYFFYGRLYQVAAVVLQYCFQYGYRINIFLQ